MTKDENAKIMSYCSKCNDSVHTLMYENKFDEEQLEEIVLGIEHDLVNVTYYAAPYIPAKLMRYIRIGLENGLTIDQIHSKISDKI